MTVDSTVTEPQPGTIVSLTSRVDQVYPTLTAAQLERIAARGRTRAITEGEVLVHSGERTAQFFVVRAGRLDVVRHTPATEEVVTSFGPGMFTGEASLLSGRRGLADIRAGASGEVIEVDRDRLLTLIQTDSELSEILMRAFILRRVELIARGVGDVVVLGSTHCQGTLRVKEFLTRNGHPYNSIDLDRDPGVQELLDRFQIKAADIPVVICRCEVVLRNPTNQQIADCLGFNEAIEQTHVRDVVVVGAGPAGLACARDLRRAGHAVTVFEAQPQPGGLNTYGIAEYKLKADVALAEVQDILDLGVELRLGVMVGRDVPFDSLMTDYDAVFVAVGLGTTKALGIPGEDLEGVVDALSFIAHLKTHPYRETKVGRRVVVVGAGNTAIDAVTQAKRLGAEQATIVYRRGEADMPCYDYEYELAKRDGCTFRFHAVPKRVVGNGRVEGLEVETPGQEVETIPCDMVIIAIGQGARREFAPPRGHPKVFEGGDGANGGAEIVNAAAEGVAAAKKIDALLRVV